MFPTEEERERSEQEFRRRCELRAMDEPVSEQQARESLDNIVKNPQRDSEDIVSLNQNVSVLENFIYTSSLIQSKARVYKSAVDQLADSMAAGANSREPGRRLVMPILNPIATLIEIRELCENNEEQSTRNVDLKLARKHDKLINTIGDLCDDTLQDIANELSGLIQKGQVP
jgi:hypothetical protein